MKTIRSIELEPIDRQFAEVNPFLTKALINKVRMDTVDYLLNVSSQITTKGIQGYLLEDDIRKVEIFTGQTVLIDFTQSPPKYFLK